MANRIQYGRVASFCMLPGSSMDTIYFLNCKIINLFYYLIFFLLKRKDNLSKIQLTIGMKSARFVNLMTVFLLSLILNQAYVVKVGFKLEDNFVNHYETHECLYFVYFVISE